MYNDKVIKQVLHDIQKNQSFFDGRYKTKVIKNKKKELNRKKCRTKIKVYLGE